MTASDRPPRAGPTLRHLIPAYSEGSTVPLPCADVDGWTARKPENASPTHNETFNTFIADSRLNRRPTILSDAVTDINKENSADADTKPSR